MSQRTVYFNGRLVPEAEARVSIFDSALMYGDMAFEMTRTYKRRPFKLREHLDRLYGSLRLLEIDCGLSLDDMERLTLETLERNLPTEPGSLDAIARRIGPPRPTNFGALFDVRAKPDPDSNAYTSIALPPHVDLPTREYQPGLQLLHCLENDTVGGEAVMMDGFAVAEALRDRHPDHFATLTRVRWCYANTARTSDYVWFDPMIKLDANGEFDEVRIADFLRGPLMAPFDDVEPAYAALVALQTLVILMKENLVAEEILTEEL